jgi:hypothetical protein
MSKGENPLVEFLYAALHSSLGVVVRTTGKADSLRSRFYQVRKDVADPQLDDLIVRPSPTDPQEVWLMKKAPDNAS